MHHTCLTVCSLRKSCIFLLCPSHRSPITSTTLLSCCEPNHKHDNFMINGIHDDSAMHPHSVITVISCVSYDCTAVPYACWSTCGSLVMMIFHQLVPHSQCHLPFVTWCHLWMTQDWLAIAFSEEEWGSEILNNLSYIKMECKCNHCMELVLV